METCLLQISPSLLRIFAYVFCKFPLSLQIFANFPLSFADFSPVFCGCFHLSFAEFPLSFEDFLPLFCGFSLLSFADVFPCLLQIFPPFHLRIFPLVFCGIFPVFSGFFSMAPSLVFFTIFFQCYEKHYIIHNFIQFYLNFVSVLH